MKFWEVIIVCSFLAFVLGFVSYNAVTHYYVSTDLKKRAAEISFLQQQVLSRLFVYGVIQTNDPARESITISLPRPVGESAQSATVIVTDSTAIYRQELQADQTGVYTSISPLTPGTFADLVPDTRVAVIFKKSGTGLEATTILFGDPL